MSRERLSLKDWKYDQKEGKMNSTKIAFKDEIEKTKLAEPRRKVKKSELFILDLKKSEILQSSTLREKISEKYSITMKYVINNSNGWV